MDEASMTHYITDAFAGVETASAYGYIFFFYGPDRKLPFATLAAADNEHDRVSNLDRPGVFRLNIGVSKQTFQSLFGTANVDVSSYDFTVLDVIMPHPHYAPQSWVCMLSPSEETFQQTVQPFLSEAYAVAIKRHAKAHPNDES